MTEDAMVKWYVCKKSGLRDARAGPPDKLCPICLIIFGLLREQTNNTLPGSRYHQRTPSETPRSLPWPAARVLRAFFCPDPLPAPFAAADRARDSLVGNAMAGELNRFNSMA